MPEGHRARSPSAGACGEWLAAAMRARDLEGRVLETGGNPAVFGERRVPGAPRTVLIYCHYDTKPIPPKAWLQPNPIEPVFRRGLAEAGAPAVELTGIADDELGGLLLHARGASDDKGPIWCHLNALELGLELDEDELRKRVIPGRRRPRARDRRLAPPARCIRIVALWGRIPFSTLPADQP